MPENWKTFKLGDICELRKDSISPKKFNNEVYLGLEHIEQGTFLLEGIGNASDVSSNKYRFLSGDILYGKIRPYFKKVYRPDFSGICSTDMLIFKTKDEKVARQDFLYHLIKTQEFTDRATETSSGTKMPRADWNSLQQIFYKFPPLPEQKAIASILSAIDDKIENNLAMNKTLEDMAMALYKHWFIDFGPFQEGEFIDSELGLIPEGWEVKSFKDLVEHSVGGDWGKETLDDNHTVKSTVIRGTDFLGAETGSFKEIPIRYIKESKFKSRKLIDGDIIIEISGGTSVRPTGRTLLVNDNLIQNLGKNVIPTSFCRLIRPVSRMHFFPLGLHIKYIYSKGKTWIYQNQSTGLSNFQYSYFAKEERIPVPKDLTIYKNFDSFITPLYKLKNTNEIKALTQLRDTLLPKLISGEVCLKEFEKEITAAL